MLYLNMGHNDIDYENKMNKELSFQFDNDIQNHLIINTLLWLGNEIPYTLLKKWLPYRINQLRRFQV